MNTKAEQLAGIVAGRVKPVLDILGQVEGLDEMFLHCCLNTIETTLQYSENGRPFIITGDIPAMWLRDSMAQVMHYVRFADDPTVAELICGVIATQTDKVLLDPYANAFTGEGVKTVHVKDRPAYRDGIWERKYEVDSLCAPVYLAQAYYKATGDTSFLTMEFHMAMQAICEVFETEQDHRNSPYSFVRVDCPPSDTLEHDGAGTPVAPCGMTWSGFRPSDDACRYGYLIPANLMAQQALGSIAEFAHAFGDEILCEKAKTLAREIGEGLRKYGTLRHPEFGEIYAYEADGLGNQHLMDDANVPSLLSLPYLHVCSADDAMYRRTRAFVLSRENPFYYEGRAAKGIGSPHTPKDHIWPISLCMQIMTGGTIREKAELLKALLTTHAGTGFMHESFHKDDPAVFTRSWFAWANSLFAETLMRLYEEGTLDEAVKLSGVKSISE